MLSRRDAIKLAMAGALSSLLSLLPEREGFVGEIPQKVKREIARLKWADEQMKTLEVEWSEVRSGGWYELEAQFTHPETQRRHGLKYKMEGEPSHEQHEKMGRKIDRAIRNTLAFPEKAMVGRAWPLPVQKEAGK